MSDAQDDDCPLSEAALAECLERRWGIAGCAVAPMSRWGHGSDTWIFRAEAGAERYFLKLKETVNESAVEVSRWLAARGLAVAGPIPTREGAAWADVGGLALLVYRYVAGVPIEPAALSETHWRALGSALRAVHDTTLPEELKRALPTEEFVPWGREFLVRLEAAAADRKRVWEPVQAAFLRMWSDQGSLPREFFEDLGDRGKRALRSEPRYCLCHNDFQAGNILWTAPGLLTLIDWDNPCWAPAEVDLMLVAPEFRPLLARGYGALAMNESVLEYVSRNWVLQESFDCAERVLFHARTGIAAKQGALELAERMLERMRRLR